MRLIGFSALFSMILCGGSCCFSDEAAWEIGGKIHFEEHSGPDYVGTLELNKVTRKILKEVFDIKSDPCANNAKVLIREKTSGLAIEHYEERSRPGIGEEIHATLLYTRKRVDNGHETLRDIYSNLTEIDERLPRQGAPTVQQVAQAYQKIIKAEWKLEIFDVVFVIGKTGSCIVAKLAFEGRDEIVNEKGRPVSGGFLHLTLVNVDSSVATEEGKINLVASKLKEKLSRKMIKIAEKHGQADLEFGVSGSKERIRP